MSELRALLALPQRGTGRAVLLITHRPASLEAADRVVRMESGRIIGS
jgi:ATP-binding cassette subfamily C protein CydD